MAAQQQEETFEIADLEYEIGGVHSLEAGNGRNPTDYIIIEYLPPV
jgi:hypothetical protein